MRSKKEVLDEISWRKKEIDRLIENPTSDNETEEYNKWRIGNMSVAIEWCKWFLNKK